MKITASPRGVLCAAGLIIAALLSGCATPPTDPEERAAFEQNNDPLEPMNRQILDINLFIDRILLKPVTKVYIAIIPEEGRDAVHNALANMKEPVVVINNVLQGEPQRAGVAVGRFAINTTVGLAGFMDIAEKWGLKQETGDFGQTLFVWGLPSGPYIMLPVLGPSNPRDAVGMVADTYMDPFSYLATVKDLDVLQITRFVVDGIDQRARVMDVLDDLQKNSLDFYAQLRSLSQQKRAAELRHGTAPAEPGINFYQDPKQTGAGGANPGQATPASVNPPQPPAPAAGNAAPPAAGLPRPAHRTPNQPTARTPPATSNSGPPAANPPLPASFSSGPSATSPSPPAPVNPVPPKPDAPPAGQSGAIPMTSVPGASLAAAPSLHP